MDIYDIAINDNDEVFAFVQEGSSFTFGTTYYAVRVFENMLDWCEELPANNSSVPFLGKGQTTPVFALLI